MSTKNITNGMACKQTVRQFVNELNSLSKEQTKQCDPLRVVTSLQRSLSHYRHGIPKRPPTDQCSKIIHKVPSYERVIKSFLDETDDTVNYFLGIFYSLLISNQQRIENGIYFTPPSLTDIVLNQVDRYYDGDPLKARWFDPSAGGGAFLVPVVHWIKKRLEYRGGSQSSILKHIEKHAFGSEIEKDLVQLCTLLLSFELRDEIALSGRKPNFNIIKGDTLDNVARRSNPTYDIVVGNPPFRKLKSFEQEYYKTEFGEILQGTSNLYALFLTQALRATRPGGLVSLILPSSLFGGRYFEKLREFINKQAVIEHIIWMEHRDRIFIDAQQETTILTMTKRAKGLKTQRGARVSIISDNGQHEPIRYQGREIKIYPAKTKNAPWVIPKNEMQAKYARLFEKHHYLLSDYGYSIHAGSLVWNRDARRRSNSLFKGGYPLLWPSCVGSNGRFCFSRAEIHAKKGLYVKFGDVQGLMRKAGVLLKRTSSTEQSRRLHAAAIPKAFVKKYGGYVGENHVYIIIPKNKVLVDNKLLSLILNSSPVDQVYRCLSGTVAISKYELLRLPLPDPDVVREALKRGKPIDDAVDLGYGMEQ